MSNAAKLRLKDLEIKPHIVARLKNAGKESIFDLAVSLPQELTECKLSGADEHIALDLVSACYSLQMEPMHKRGYQHYQTITNQTIILVDSNNGKF